ncbi:MAG: hypothetical protein AAF494_00705 [Pseudomonadota bacterium]
MAETAELERRRIATAKTFARYAEQPFDWRKSTTCLHMARMQMRGMGHRPPKMPPLRSAVRARKELEARGHANVIGLLDTMLPRIAPAQMRLGDLAAAPGSEEWLDAILINVAPRKFAGWREDQHLMVVLDISLDQITAAWRL